MSLKTKIVFLLFMMLAVAVCNLIVIYNFLTHHEGGAHVIDVAGRQRMFVQKISKLAFAVANGSESERHPLEETVELYNTSLFFLRDGGHIKGRLIQVAPRDMDQLFGNNETVWNLFRKKALIIARNRCDNLLFTDSLAHISRENEMLLTRCDNVVLAYDLLPDSDKYSHEINVAGRQRMLSQKISKLAFSIAAGSDVQRGLLLKLVELFDKSHLSLLGGGVSVPWKGEIKTPPPDVKVALERVSKVWPEFKKSAVAVAGNATDNPVFKEALGHIRRNSDRLLGISDQITRRFAENLRHKVLVLKWVLAIMFCVDVVIFLIGYFLSARIVRPIRELSTATAEVGRGVLKRTVQVATHDEIGELGIAFNKMTDDLKRSRDELISAKEFANSILESMIDPLFVLDLDGMITKLNTAAINLLGCTEEELTGEFLNEIIDKGECSDDLDLIRGVVEKGDLGYYKTKDGNTIPVNLHTSVMKDEKGKYCGYACVGRDMRQIKGLINELETSNRELEDFAYIASHDLKEPLRGIHNYSSFLVKDYADKLGEDGKSKLFTMIFLCRRLDKLIDDLLYFSRVGRVKDSMQYTDLNQIVDRVLGTLKIRTEEEGIEIRFKRDMPGIVCDRVRMKDIFLNLITNAIKYNDKDEKWVEIGYYQASEAGSHIFYVRDNGIGIRKKHIDSVFKIFRRLHGRDEFGGGTGAGLTIAKKIVETSGGNIWVESVFGRGTTFYFMLRENGHAKHL